RTHRRAGAVSDAREGGRHPARAPSAARADVVVRAAARTQALWAMHEVRGTALGLRARRRAGSDRVRVRSAPAQKGRATGLIGVRQGGPSAWYQHVRPAASRTMIVDERVP